MQLRTCLLTAFALTTAVTFGVAAQQTSNQDAWQAGASVLQAYNKAMQARDAAGLVALFSEDAILLTPDGPLVGHAAIEKRFEGLFKAIVSKEPSKLEKVVMVSDALRLRTGSWSAVVQSPNGPMPLKGYWSTTDLRDGNSWKIRMETDNVTMPPEAREITLPAAVSAGVVISAPAAAWRELPRSCVTSPSRPAQGYDFSKTKPSTKRRRQLSELRSSLYRLRAYDPPPRNR